MDSIRHPVDPDRSQHAPAAPLRWTVPDLIDFEHYLDLDERTLRDRPSSRKSLTERDHSIYVDTIAPRVTAHQPHTRAHRRISLRGWLAERRTAEDPGIRALLPGSAFASAQRLLTILVVILGLSIGYGLAATLLSYDGTRPVSVTWYLFLLVFVQFALIVTVLAAWILRRTRGGGDRSPHSVLTHLMRPLILKLTQWLQERRLGQAATEVQERIHARQGVFKAQHALYGPVSYLPLLILAQTSGLRSMSVSSSPPSCWNCSPIWHSGGDRH